MEASLAAITDAFHKIGNEYGHLCSIVPHMTKTWAANVIGRLPIIPFMGKGAPVKIETKTEPRKSEPTMTSTTTQESTTMTMGTAEQERITEIPIIPRMPPVVEVDTNLEKEINIEKDAETSKKVTKTTGETGAEPEKV